MTADEKIAALEKRVVVLETQVQLLNQRGVSFPSWMFETHPPIPAPLWPMKGEFIPRVPGLTWC